MKLVKFRIMKKNRRKRIKLLKAYNRKEMNLIRGIFNSKKFRDKKFYLI